MKSFVDTLDTQTFLVSQLDVLFRKTGGRVGWILVLFLRAGLGNRAFLELGRGLRIRVKF